MGLRHSEDAAVAEAESGGESRREGQRAMGTEGRPVGYCSVQAVPFQTSPREWEPPQHTPNAPVSRHGSYWSAIAAWSLACLPLAGPPLLPCTEPGMAPTR